MKLWSVVLLLLLVAGAVRTQPLSMRIIDERVGLSSRSMSHALVDRHGFVWFHTRDGLDRWDGRSMHSYTHRNRDTASIPRSWASWGFERANGDLVFFHSKGMSILDRARDGFVNWYPSGSVDGDNSLHGSAEVSNDSLLYMWTGGSEHWMVHVDRRRRVRLYVRDPRSGELTDLSRSTQPVFDEQGRFWAITPVGLGWVRWPDSVLRVVEPSLTAHPFHVDRSLHSVGRFAWSIRTSLDRLLWVDLSDRTTIRSYDVPKEIADVHVVHASVAKTGQLFMVLEDNRVVVVSKPASDAAPVVRVLQRPLNIGADSVLDLRMMGAEDVVADPQGRYWWGVRKGLLRFDPASMSYSYHPIAELTSLHVPILRVMFIDRHDRIIVSLTGIGAGIIDPQRPIRAQLDPASIKLTAPGLKTAHIITLDGQRSLIIPRIASQPLTILDATGAVLERLRIDGDRLVPARDTMAASDAVQITSVLRRSDGTIWLGLRGGIIEMDLRQYRCKHHALPPPPGTQPNPWARVVSKLFVDPNDVLWACTEHGILRYDPISATFSRTLHGKEAGALNIYNAITGYAIDPSARTWVYGMMQFGRLSADGTRLDVMRVKRSDTTVADLEGILALAFTSNDNAVIVDRYGPSTLDMRTGTMRRLTTPWTDPDRAAYLQGFYDGAGSMWMVTSSTLQRLDLRTLALSLIPLDDEHGSYRMERVVMVDQGAKRSLWVMHARGIDILDVGSLRAYDVEAPVVMTSVDIHDTLVTMPRWIGSTDTLRLSYDDMPFTIRFAAIAPTVGEHLRYRVLLEGVDERWVNVTTRLEARYQNIQPGTYAFRVQYMGLDGKWHEPRRPLIVMISPPWWQTWWFRFSVAGVVVAGAWGAYRRRVRTLADRNRELEHLVQERTMDLAAEREKSEALLLNVLPSPVAQRLKSGERDIADQYPNVSVIFADIVGFTPLSSTLDPRDTVRLLNELFSRFDRIAREHGAERIKTIGDAYMAAVGVPTPVADHALRATRFALHLLRDVAEYSRHAGHVLHLRIGINYGDVVAAVVGESKFAYDLWSDAVNVAARMEVYGEPDRIHCTEEFADELRRWAPADIVVTPRGMINVKGKGEMSTYWITPA
jgi:class 3 adenylate cyclase/ligand-binding sensor domain-containing protein